MSLGIGEPCKKYRNFFPAKPGNAASSFSYRSGANRKSRSNRPSSPCHRLSADQLLFRAFCSGAMMTRSPDRSSGSSSSSMTAVPMSA